MMNILLVTLWLVPCLCTGLDSNQIATDALVELNGKGNYSAYPLELLSIYMTSTSTSIINNFMIADAELRMIISEKRCTNQANDDDTSEPSDACVPIHFDCHAVWKKTGNAPGRFATLECTEIDAGKAKKRTIFSSSSSSSSSSTTHGDNPAGSQRFIKTSSSSSSSSASANTG